MKKVITLVLTALIALGTTACNRKTHYFDDVSCDTLADQAIASFDSVEQYTTADALFLNDYFITPEYVRDSVIRFSTDSGNLNEIGVFHTEEGRAKEFSVMLQNYLLRSYQKNHTWYDSYIPNETPKLRDAEIRIWGNYVVYTVLNKDAKNKVFSTLDTLVRTSATENAV